VFAWEALLTAALGLVVYGCAVANSAFKPAAPVGIAAFVTCAIMAGEEHRIFLDGQRSIMKAGSMCAVMCGSPASWVLSSS
jgi:hypothetical protein